MQSSFLANILSGSLIALVNISVDVSVAALLSAQVDPSLLVPGIAILLMGTLVTGLGGSLFSDYKAVICSPRNGLVPVFAVMVGSIYNSFGSVYSIAAEATIIAAIMVTTMVAGLFLLLLGRLKMGNLVRVIPYPVTGFFFPGIGYFCTRWFDGCRRRAADDWLPCGCAVYPAGNSGYRARRLFDYGGNA
jgi:SulP family sulfate permease